MGSTMGETGKVLQDDQSFLSPRMQVLEIGRGGRRRKGGRVSPLTFLLVPGLGSSLESGLHGVHFQCP